MSNTVKATKMASLRGYLSMTGQPNTACFDIFDTVLFRSLLDPTDVFRLISYRLKAILPQKMAMVGEDAFVSARSLAEHRARLGKSEVTLADIWHELTWLVGENLDDAMEVELACEREVLFPNSKICLEITARRAQGLQIAFISDMYLPEYFLRSVLEEHGIMQRDDKIFVSSTSGKTKRSGQLYHHVIADLGGKPGHYHMTGDHRHSDNRVPRSIGLKSKHYRGYRLNRYERRLNDKLKIPHLARSVLVGSIRNGRTNHGIEVDRLVTDFLGPASLLWAIWSIRRAEDGDLNRLFFMSRDAYLPYLCAKQIATHGRTQIKSSYLYASRYSLYFASIKNLFEDVQWIFNQPGELTKVKLLRYLRLDPHRLCSSVTELLLRYDDDKILDRADFDLFFATLERSDDGVVVLESAAQMREATQAYYKAEGLAGPDESAIVDIGWHLNIQAALQGLISEKQMRGQYLYLSQDRRRPSEVGEAEAMIELGVPHSRVSSTPALWRHATLVEHLFGMVPEGTCTGFCQDESGNVRPILQGICPEEAALKHEICEKVQTFACKWIDLYMQAFPTAERCATAFAAVSDEYLQNPTRDSLLAIPQAFRLSKEALNDHTSPIAGSFEWSDIAKVISKIRRRHQAEGLGWLGAKLAMAPVPINRGREIIRKIRPYLG